jgi:hypothetical protein
MKPILVKLIDLLLAALFLLAAYDSLWIFSAAGFDIPYIGILLSLFYVGIAFGLIRTIPLIKYLVYANSIVGILIAGGLGVFSFIKGIFYYPLIIALVIYVLSSLHCHQRFKQVDFKSSFGKEFGYFVLTVISLIGVLAVGDHYFQWGHQTVSLSGPISIRK